MAERTNWRARGLAALILLGLVGGGYLFGTRISDDQADQLISAHCPPGCDTREVLRFLKTRHWAYWGPRGVDASEQREDPDWIEYGAASVIDAEVDNVVPGCKGAGFLQIGFAFDRQGKLSRYLVKQIGPDVL